MNSTNNQGNDLTQPEGSTSPPPQATTPLPGYPPAQPGQQTQQTQYDPYGYNPYGPSTGGTTPPQQQTPYVDYRDARHTYRDQRRAARDQYRADHPHRVPIVGPLLLILAGVLFLLNNLGILDWSIWDSLWRLWPLVLVIIGIDLLVGRRSPLLSFLLVVVVLALGAALLYSSGGFVSNGSIQQQTLSAPLNNAQAATVRVQIGVGDLRIDSGEGAQLASGMLDYFENRGAPTINTDTSGGGATLSIKQRSTDGMNFVPSFIGSSRGLNWDIHLSPQPTLDLDLNTGAGRTTLDLGKLRVSNLKLNSGAGSTSVIFPSQAGTTTASVDGGVGSIDITIPSNVEAHIKVDTGVGSLNVDSRFKKVANDVYESAGYSDAKNKLDLDINAGVGSLNIQSTLP